MTDIILSIHPKWAELILQNKKKIEVRKRVPKGIRCGDKIYLYSTSPIKKIVGSCVLDGVQTACFTAYDSELESACLTRPEYEKYANDNQTQLFLLRDPIRFDVPMELNKLGVERAPQSFCYVKVVE